MMTSRLFGSPPTPRKAIALPLPFAHLFPGMPSIGLILLWFQIKSVKVFKEIIPSNLFDSSGFLTNGLYLITGHLFCYSRDIGSIHHHFQVDCWT